MSTTTKAEIHDVLHLIDYQTDAIVSRQIIKAEPGNVTLFAFDRGQELSEHTAPYDALVHILDGEAEIKLSGKPYLLKSGNMIIMPANEPHAVRALQQFMMLLTMIKA